MASQIELNRVGLSKPQYLRVIDTTFTELVPVGSTGSFIDPTSVPQFFQDYNTLFFEIPKFGETNSHEYLIATSQDYIGNPVESAEIIALQQEITNLREQLLEANRIISQISSEI